MGISTHRKVVFVKKGDTIRAQRRCGRKKQIAIFFLVFFYGHTNFKSNLTMCMHLKKSYISYSKYNNSSIHVCPRRGQDYKYEWWRWEDLVDSAHFVTENRAVKIRPVWCTYYRVRYVYNNNNEWLTTSSSVIFVGSKPKPKKKSQTRDGEWTGRIPRGSQENVRHYHKNLRVCARLGLFIHTYICTYIKFNFVLSLERIYNAAGDITSDIITSKYYYYGGGCGGGGMTEYIECGENERNTRNWQKSVEENLVGEREIYCLLLLYIFIRYVQYDM